MYTHNISKKIATRRRRELLSDSLGGNKKTQLFKEYVTYHKKGRLTYLPIRGGVDPPFE